MRCLLIQIANNVNLGHLHSLAEKKYGVLDPPLSAELKKIFASSHKLVEGIGTSVPGAAASSSSEPMVAQPCVYVVRPAVDDATSSAGSAATSKRT